MRRGARSTFVARAALTGAMTLQPACPRETAEPADLHDLPPSAAVAQQARS